MKKSHSEPRIENQCGNFPGSPVAKSSPSDAGNTGYIPGQGTKIPHAVEQRHSPNAPELTPHK